MAFVRFEHSLGIAQEPSKIVGLATIARLMFGNVDISPVRQALLDRIGKNERDAGALHDLSTIELLSGNRESGLALQAMALQRQKLYRRPSLQPDPFRLLALAAPGDFMMNTPLEFLLEETNVSLDILYLRQGESFPHELPECDAVFVAVAESDANQPILEAIAQASQSIARPLVNDAKKIARLTRDGAWSLLQDAAGVVYPPNWRVARGRLADFALPRGWRYPIIARPVGSHAGNDLHKLDDDAGLDDYLKAQPAQEFYIAPFVDYSNEDGLFRKYRIALVDGAAFPVHMAISKNWMVHYLNADMFDNASHRAEEKQFMNRFDEDFGRRHARALKSVVERTGLDYLLLDCAETSGGELLIFETGTAMIVHSLDPIEIFPYKPAHMGRLFSGFTRMLHRVFSASR